MNPRPDHGETSYKGSGKLAGMTALITGGDSGIGRAAAIACAHEGADVAIIDLPAEEPGAREVVALIEAEGRKAVAIPGDLRTEDFCRTLVAEAHEQPGELDILVDNATRQQTRPAIADISSEDFDDTMKTKVHAPFWQTKAALERLEAGAIIVNTSSEQAGNPSPDIVDYALTRAAVLNLTKAMAKQVAPRGIRVNAVAPGSFWTPLQVSGGATAEKPKTFGADSPTGQVFGSSGGNGQPA